ncbi:MAG: sulfatase [bacterium]
MISIEEDHSFRNSQNDSNGPLPRTSRWPLRVFGVVVLIIGLVSLGSYLWRGRLPHDTHSTDGSWLPGNEKAINGSGLLKSLNKSNYRAHSFLNSPPEKILLITIDTLRADHLSSYGYPKNTSPFLDSLTRDGIVFTNAYAPSSTTVPSHSSIMTGLYPMQTGVETNHHKLNSQHQTLAEHLSQEGYTTAGFVSTNRHFKPTDLDQGFKTFNEPTKEEQYFSLPDSDTTYNLHYRSAGRTLERAGKWIQSSGQSEKQFVWIHLFDPHYPYAYRPETHDPLRYQDDERRHDWMGFIKENHHFDLWSGPRPDHPNQDPYISAYRLYDGEIRYVDSQLEEFFESLQGKWSSDRLTIITSDHGEGLGNHNWWGHTKYVYNEQIRVPLIIHHPRKHWDRTVESVVELNDLFTTISREAGVPYSSVKSDTISLHSTPIQGLLHQSFDDQFNYAFAARRPYSNDMTSVFAWLKWRWRELTVPPLMYPLHDEYRWRRIRWPGRQFALVGDTSSYIYNTALRDEFYDQQSDFYQTKNLIVDSPKRWKPYGSTIRRLLNSLNQESPTGSSTVDQATREKLRGLGYVN